LDQKLLSRINMKSV